MYITNKKYLVEYGLFFLVALFLLARPIGDMDEIWNYNFGFNICNGLQPYSDFNCIVTPLSAYISSLFLSVFGNSLFTFRITGILLLATTFYVLFLLLHSCSRNRILAFTCTSFAFALCYLVWIYNYNNLNLLLILFALYLELKIDQRGQNTPTIFCFMIGLTYGAVFLIKQSVGALLLVYNGIVCLITWFTLTDQRSHSVLRLVSSLILPLFFSTYLVISGSFSGFWDYAVAGIGTFSHKITYWEFISTSFINLLIGLFPIIITIFSVVAIIKGTSNVSRKFHVLALLISWIGLSVAYPLCDYIHMCIGVVPFAVCAFCCFKPPRLKRWEHIVCAIVSIVILLSIGATEVKVTDKYKICELNHFEGLVIEKDLEKQLESVGRFIREKENAGVDVLMADSYAAAYLLPLDKYYKDFSLLNRGNLGTQSVSDLLWREDAVYLVNSDITALNQQSHFELIEYILTNYKKTGEVLGFDVYETQ